MAITPGQGFQVDPNNPNGVIPMAGTQTVAYNNAPNFASSSTVPSAPMATGSATAPAVAPQPSAPTPAQTPAPTPAPVNVNVNTGAPQGDTGTPATSTSTQTQGQTPLQMPANGSVIDLLNGVGQASDINSRAKLAQTLGVPYDVNASGKTSAAQNTALASKYIEAYNKLKTTPTPQSGATASSALDQHFADNKQQTDPQKNSFDQYMSMNPVVKHIYDTIQQALSAPKTQQSFADEYKQLMSEQGIPQLQTDKMNIQNVMKGTEDDIRTEITKAGGFATNSQVAGMVAAKNKVLLQQANTIDQQLQQKEDYVNHIMQLSQADRAEVDKQVTQTLGLEGKLLEIQDKINTSATDNYNKVITTVGYSGLIQTLKGQPDLQAHVEGLLGLPKGSLDVGSPLSLSVGTAGTKDKPQIIGSASTGYFSYDPTTKTSTKILAGSGGTADKTATEGQDLADAKAFLTANSSIDPNTAKQKFLQAHPTASAAWDAYFGVSANANNYPKAPAPAKSGLFGWGFLGL